MGKLDRIKLYDSEGYVIWSDRKNDSKYFDDGIRDLARVIQALDITTFGSCQGHIGKHGTHPFPWVSGYLDNKPEIKNLIGIYNKSSDIKWEIEISWLKPDSEAKNDVQLKKLQHSAEKLAMFLYEYVKDPAKRDYARRAYC